tara:strand:+ start:2750 stop:3205 length:456 start_codon:yes stop_codon:yes gene_type:complete
MSNKDLQNKLKEIQSEFEYEITSPSDASNNTAADQYGHYATILGSSLANWSFVSASSALQYSCPQSETDIKDFQNLVDRYRLKPVDTSKEKPLISAKLPDGTTYSLVELLKALSNPLMTELLFKTLMQLSKDMHKIQTKIDHLENILDKEK